MQPRSHGAAANVNTERQLMSMACTCAWGLIRGCAPHDMGYDGIDAHQSNVGGRTVPYAVTTPSPGTRGCSSARRGTARRP